MHAGTEPGPPALFDIGGSWNLHVAVWAVVCGWVRLKALLLDRWKPAQIVFAGKAHPADDGGKALIQQVYRLAKDPAFGGRIAFAEDYDMHLARYFVHGCDLWLNNPLAPLEACGTSGLKAAVNGVPSLSVLDGWWEEGFNGANGWAIGSPGDGQGVRRADVHPRGLSRGGQARLAAASSSASP